VLRLDLPAVKDIYCWSHLPKTYICTFS